MKNISMVVALSCVACQPSARAPDGALRPKPEQEAQAERTIDVVGLAQPESAIHDPVADVYLVSNVAGSPFEQDGLGFISRIANDGKLLDRAWISGLDAPKGLAIRGDTLAVSDLTVLRRFDRESGAPRDVVTIPGATFLNDVTSAPDGSFLVSDSGFRAQGEGIEPTGSDAIYRVDTQGNVTRFAAGRELSLPNGLTFLGDQLVMAPFGASKLLRFSGDGSLLDQLELPVGQLDGIVALENGCLLVSSLQAGGILHGRVGGSFSILQEVVAMDIGLDTRRGRLLLPMMMSDTLRILPLAGLDACP